MDRKEDLVPLGWLEGKGAFGSAELKSNLSCDVLMELVGPSVLVRVGMRGVSRCVRHRGDAR